jgi:hypothetical protein
MSWKTVFCISFVLLASPLMADDMEDEERTVSGMSIVGNHEAPKSLVIVPWKSSEIGLEPGLSSDVLDDMANPVDRDVFLRELDYYQIRTAHPTEL